MSEVDTYQHPQQYTQQLQSSDPTGGRLVAWAATLSAAKQIADALCATTFAPQHFRGKPDDGAAAIMFGDEIGLSPTQALRSIYVISGSPALYTRQMVAIVLAHGHEVWTVDKTDTQVTVAGKRSGSQHTHTETWTTARARQAGYTSNKKYETNPQAMLYARAAADICRQIAPDALAGVAYSVEELEAEQRPTTTQRRALAAPQTTPVQRAAIPAREPDLEPAGDVEPITPAQLAKLHACLNDAGKGDRDTALGYISALVERSIMSSKDLTKHEASAVIDELTSLIEEPFVPPVEDTPLPPETT